jgi:hypothetical protein
VLVTAPFAHLIWMSMSKVPHPLLVSSKCGPYQSLHEQNRENVVSKCQVASRIGNELRSLRLSGAVISDLLPSKHQFYLGRA